MQLQGSSTFTNLLNFLFVYAQGSPLLCQPIFPNNPHMQTFLTLQSKQAREKKLSLYNNSPFRGRNSTKFRIIVMQMFTIFYINFWKNWLFTVFCFSSPFPLYSMLDLIFRTCPLSRKHSLNQPWQHWAGGERGGVFLTGRRGKGHFGSLENGLHSYKPIPRLW